jgi:hypothetical protein
MFDRLWKVGVTEVKSLVCVEKGRGQVFGLCLEDEESKLCCEISVLSN